MNAMEPDAATMDLMIKDGFWSAEIENYQIKNDLRLYYVSIIIAEVYVALTAILLTVTILYMRVCPKWPLIDYESETQKTIFAVCFLLYAFGVFISTCVNISITFYYCIHLKIQMSVLGWYFRQTEYTSDGTNSTYYDAHHHHLVICIVQYIRLVRCVRIDLIHQS